MKKLARLTPQKNLITSDASKTPELEEQGVETAREGTPNTVKTLGPCTLADFELGCVLGTGSFGRVCLARHKTTGTVCAIKTLSKTHILKKQQLPHLRSEREILREIIHPFAVRLYAHFQDEACVHLVMEYIAGGEFFSHLRARERLSEGDARIYAAEVILVFEYLHSKDIVYRDLKPENMLLDDQGHMKLTDFGFAKHVPSAKRTYTLCGTPDYLSPEVILNKGHGKAVDWWALGILIYEMLAGYPPFADDDPMQTYAKILAGNFTFPPYFSVHAKDLVRRLIQSDLTRRLGCLAGGVGDIKGHPWFKGLDWKALVKRKVEAPIKPKIKALDDTSNFDDYSNLPPIKQDFQLSSADQLLFVGF